VAVTYKLVRETESLEELLKAQDPEKVPEDLQNHFKQVQDLFIHPEVLDCRAGTGYKLEFPEPEYEAMKKFLIEDNQFSSERVEKQIEKLKAARKQKTQMRLDSFFTVNKTQIKETDKYTGKRAAPAITGNKNAAAKKKAKK
jgi:flap endonuclease-1